MEMSVNRKQRTTIVPSLTVAVFIVLVTITVNNDNLQVWATSWPTTRQSSWGIVSTKKALASVGSSFARLPFSVLAIHRGGSLESSIADGDDDDDEEDEDDGPIDDVLAAEEKAEAEASTIEDQDDVDNEEEEGEGDEEFFDAVQNEEELASTASSSAPKADVGAENADENSNTQTTEGEILDDPSLDEHSSANIDRMDYADAYDEEVEADEEIETKAEGNVEETPAAASTVSSPPIEEEKSAATNEDTPKIPLVSEITPAMKEILIKKLKYRRSEVANLRPEIAAVVVAKELQRPQEGLPPHWLIVNNKPKRSSTKSLVLSLVAVAAAVAGGTAVSSSVGSDFVWVPTESKARPSSFYEPPSLPSVSQPQVQEEPETLPEPEEEKEEESFFAPIQHEHSLRPHERPPPEPIDETALDKVLTKVEKALGKVFGR